MLVGTPTYLDPGLPDIPVIGRNVPDLARALTDPGLGGFDAASCLVAPPNASLSEVGDLLSHGAREAEDLLLFYYCGHGLLSPRRRELYLSLAGTKPDRLPYTALSFEAVRDACLDSRAKIRIVILDSCFSGRAIGQALAADEVLGQVEVAGTYTLCAAPANRTALVIPGEEHTAFTERLLQLLWTGTAAAGPLLTMADIYHHLLARLRSEGLPEPQQCGTETADLLALSRNPGYALPIETERRSAPTAQVPTDSRLDAADPPVEPDATIEMSPITASAPESPLPSFEIVRKGYDIPQVNDYFNTPPGRRDPSPRFKIVRRGFAVDQVDRHLAKSARTASELDAAEPPVEPRAFYLGFDIVRRGYDILQVNAYFSIPPDRRDPNPHFEVVRNGFAVDQVDRHLARSARTGEPASSTLPQMVPYAALPEPAERPSFALPLGIAESPYQTLFLNFTQEPHFLMFGESESGKTSALRTIIKGITEMYTGDQSRILLVDYRRSLLGVVPDSHGLGYCAASGAVAACVAEIAPFLDKRRPGPNVTAEQLRNRSWWRGPEIFVIVDDYELIVTSGGNPLASLAEYLPLAEDCGLHFIVARASNGAGRSLSDPLIRRMRENRQPTLLLSGDPAEGPLIDSVHATHQPPGRGTLISRRLGPILIQTAFTPSAA